MDLTEPIQDRHDDALVPTLGLPADELAQLDTHFRYGADELTEAELEAMYEAQADKPSTGAIIAAGNLAAVDAVTALFEAPMSK